MTKLDPAACRRLAHWASNMVPAAEHLRTGDHDRLAAVADQLTAAAEMQERHDLTAGDYADSLRSVAAERDEAMAERDALRAQLAERPALTADEVRAVVIEAFSSQLNIVHGMLSPSDGDAIAVRVAEKLAGKARP